MEIKSESGRGSENENRFKNKKKAQGIRGIE